MISSQAMCKSYLLELHQAVHDWDTDQFKLALYQATANLDPDVIAAYTALNETVGTGYVAGGYNLAITAGFPKVSLTSRKWLVDFVDIAVNPAVFSTRRGLIYNSSKANRSVAVIQFGYTYNPTVSFGIQWPPNDDDNCIIRLGA
jgi:hypothetical protein